MKEKLLYIGMKYDYGDKSRGLSFEHRNFYHSLKSYCRIHGWEFIHFDFVERGNILGIDLMTEELLELSKRENPNYLFAVLFDFNIDPRHEVFKRISELGVTTIHWFCDDHWRFEKYSSIITPNFNFICTTANSALPKYKKMGIYDRVIKTQWACNNELYVPLDIKKDIEISFVGQRHGDRKQVFDKIIESGLELKIFGYNWEHFPRIPFHQMVRVFSRSKINLNLSNSSTMVEQQIKGRNFEIPGTKSFLLTGNAENLQEYFEDGKEIVIFNSPEELIDKAKYYLAHETERKTIAEYAFKRTISEHTWQHRFDDIFKLVISNKSNKPEASNNKNNKNNGKQNQTKNNPAVSIVIPCYNQGEYLPDALDSISKQKFENFECIVVNDGSTDNSKEIIEDFIRLNSRLNISLITTKNNGLSGARNEGIKKAKGEFILPLDADDTLKVNALERFFLIANEFKEYDIFYPDYETFGVVNKYVSCIDEFEFQNPLRNENGLPYCSFYKKEVWTKNSGYNSNMIWGFEDWDFWLSSLQNGFKAKRIAEPLFNYRIKNQSMITNALKYKEYLLAIMVYNNRNLYDTIVFKNVMNFIIAKPIVSVIIATYNRPILLRNAIKSVVEQYFPLFEILVINDAGEDVKDIIGSFNDDRIKYFEHKNNKGLAASRNTGIKNSKGKYIAYLDDDDTYYPNHLEVLLKNLESDSEYKVAYSDALRATYKITEGKYYLEKKELIYSQDFDYEKILWGNFIPVLCIMHEKSCIESVGLFDETLTTHEDWDLWIRISREFKFKHIKTVTSEFRWVEDGSSMTSSKEVDFLNTTKIIYKKYENLTKDNKKILEEQKKTIIWRESKVVNLNQVKLNNEILVSIIIPVFNKIEFTKNCLEAIFQTVKGIPYEIIVVDNASSDNTKQVLKAFQSSNENLVVIHNEENLKFAKACNIGAKISKGKFLVFLNNDTIPQVGWLNIAIKRLESNHRIGIVGSKLLYPDGTIQHCGIDFFEFANREYLFWPLHRHLKHHNNDPIVNIPGEVTAVTGACLLIRRELFFQVGEFDISYGMYFEDLDLNFKVRKAGYKIFYEPKSVIVHYEGISSKDRVEIDKLNKRAGDIFFGKWSNEIFSLQFEKHIIKTIDRFFFINNDIYPRIENLNLNYNSDSEIFKKHIGILLTKLNSIGPSFIHIGGVGDALLLLSTFYDRDPEQTIISFANSVEALKSLWDAFPKVKKIYLIPVPQNPIIHSIIRNFFRKSSKFLGAGVMPSESYFDEWNAEVNIFQKYGIVEHPKWANDFRGSKIVDFQITIAPMGSRLGMVGSKRNIIDPEIWKKLIQFIIDKNIRPIILGTPNESKIFPYLDGCIDKRSFNFDEQIRLIASSDLFIGADSWGKTLSALAGIPTIVFRSFYGDDLKDWKDNSDYIFLDPWKNITVVNNYSEFQKTFNNIFENISKKQCSNATISIVWEGPQFVNSSLALVNRELCTLIAGSRLNLSLNKTVNDQFNHAIDSKHFLLNNKSNVKLENVDIHVRHQWPPNLTPPEIGHWVIIQPWEYGSLPKKWANEFSKLVDEMWVPSNYVRQVYIDSGIPSERVFVIPNGFDPQKFNPDVKPYRLQTKKKYKFLFVGGTIYRKGIDVLLQTYISTFKNVDDVVLIIKDMGGDSFYKGQTFKEKIIEIQKTKGTPEIIYLDKNLSEKDLAGLYTACDVLVHPYRGEGFGFPILESMASGTPVIVTNGGAAMDFCNENNSLLIKAEKRFSNENKIGDIETVNLPWILEPDQLDLAKKMLFAFDNKEKTKEIGIKAYNDVKENWTWQNSFEKLNIRIQEIAKKPILRFIKTEKTDLNKSNNKLLDAEEFINKNNLNEARYILNDLIEKEKYNIKALNDLSVVEILEENYEMGLEIIERILNVEPHYEVALTNKKFVEMKLLEVGSLK
ncbi:MAG: glycosyltransferase [Ignavibacteriaceae bacterium]